MRPAPCISPSLGLMASNSRLPLVEACARLQPVWDHHTFVTSTVWDTASAKPSSSSS